MDFDSVKQRLNKQTFALLTPGVGVLPEKLNDDAERTAFAAYGRHGPVIEKPSGNQAVISRLAFNGSIRSKLDLAAVNGGVSVSRTGVEAIARGWIWGVAWRLSKEYFWTVQKKLAFFIRTFPFRKSMLIPAAGVTYNSNRGDRT